MHRLTRRNVLARMASSTALLCPAILQAQTVNTNWGEIETDKPVGMDAIFELPAGPATVDISALAKGEVAVIARPSDDAKFSATGQVDYIAVLHRTDEQVASAQVTARAVPVQNADYLVVSLLCPHRGKAIGITGDTSFPFACTDQGRRHASVFDSSGAGISGASSDEAMLVPDYMLNGTTLSLA